MPELAALFLIGSTASLLTAVAFAYFQLSKYKSPSNLQLQKNLGLLRLRYNDIESSVESLNAEVENVETEIWQALKAEKQKAQSTYILFGFFAVFLSWLGFVFLVLMWVSLAKLVRNRLEEALMSSELSKKDLPREQVEIIWSEIQNK